MWNLKKDITVNVCSSSFQWYNTHCILMTFNFFVTPMLGAICGSAISMDLLASAIYGSILCAEIHGLRRYLWIAQGSCLRGPRGKFAGPVPESHFFKLIFLDSLHYMFGQLFPTYQSGAKRKCVIIVILRQVPALSACREHVPTPTVCDFVPWIVEAH